MSATLYGCVADSVFFLLGLPTCLLVLFSMITTLNSRLTTHRIPVRAITIEQKINETTVLHIKPVCFN